jgi:hypothetical protein
MGFFQNEIYGNRGTNYKWSVGTCVLRTPHEGAADSFAPALPSGCAPAFVNGAREVAISGKVFGFWRKIHGHRESPQCTCCRSDAAKAGWRCSLLGPPGRAAICAHMSDDPLRIVAGQTSEKIATLMTTPQKKEVPEREAA